MEGGLGQGRGRAEAQEGWLAPQTHVVGLKKLLGSEALAGVRPALAPEAGGGGGGRCRGGELSTSRSLSSRAWRTQRTLTPAGEWGRPSGKGRQSASPWSWMCSGKLSSVRTPDLGWRNLWGRGGESCAQGLDGAQQGTDRSSAFLQPSWGDSWLGVSSRDVCVFFGPGKGDY